MATGPARGVGAGIAVTGSAGGATVGGGVPATTPAYEAGAERWAGGCWAGEYLAVSSPVSLPASPPTAA